VRTEAGRGGRRRDTPTAIRMLCSAHSTERCQPKDASTTKRILHFALLNTLTSAFKIEDFSMLPTISALNAVQRISAASGRAGRLFTSNL
jgi:hypothetical protein